ncbi:MAG: hypothetical protein IPK83_23350 [Planctomycetes bacterium]|nr:hypothetical protein [Planctomycetota bacterium]
MAGCLLTFVGFRIVQFSWNAAVEGQIGTLSVERNWPIRVYLEAGVFIGVGSCIFCFGCLCNLSGLLSEGVLSSKAYERFVINPIGAPGCAAFLLAILLALLVWVGRIVDWVASNLEGRHFIWW